MEKECDMGNIEYKRYIKFASEKKKSSLISQLKFRLKEGNGICFYNIGVEDNGDIYNISDDNYNETILNLKFMCDQINAEILLIEKKFIINNDNILNDYYYQIYIADKISNNEIRILNVSSKNNLELLGLDNENKIINNNENSIYDIKKNSKLYFYINNINNLNNYMILKFMLTFKPHIINISENIKIDNKIISLIKNIGILYTFYENINENINQIKNISNNIFESKNLMSLFNVLYKGNVINQNKIYACITSKNLNSIENIYLYTSDNNKKIKINDIQHITQSINSINKDKLISISTNEKIMNEYHICENKNCNILIDDVIYYNYPEKYNNKEYNAYYKNLIFKIKFNDGKIILFKKIFLDEKYLIIDLIDEYLLVNLF
uniref:Uncharacterized protein n=1 Tax=viral metagenome TaxID=1070528 RepID=A0A6C0GZZ6_9ZZZZ